jgi:hypothetical protein
LQQETQQAVTAREEAEMQMQKASDMVAAVQRSRDESLLKEKEAVFQVRSAITAVFQSLICRTVAKYVSSTRQSAPSC